MKRVPEYSTRTRLFLAFLKPTFRGQVDTLDRPEPATTYIIRQIPDYQNWSLKALFHLFYYLKIADYFFWNLRIFFFIIFSYIFGKNIPDPTFQNSRLTRIWLFILPEVLAPSLITKLYFTQSWMKFNIFPCKKNIRHEFFFVHLLFPSLKV